MLRIKPVFVKRNSPQWVFINIIWAWDNLKDNATFQYAIFTENEEQKPLDQLEYGEVHIADYDITDENGTRTSTAYTDWDNSNEQAIDFVVKYLWLELDREFIIS